MDLKEQIKGILHAAINWKQLEQERNSLYEANNFLQNNIDDLRDYAEKVDMELDRLLNEAEETREIIAEKDATIVGLQPWNTQLDSYCRKAYKIIDNIAYTQKRKTVLDNDYNIYLQECVIPESWEVKNFFRRLILNGTRRENIAKIGDKTAKTITWTSDHNLSTSGDYYLLPSETIADQKGDCEDHTFINMSADREIGGAWGFLTKNGEKFGHAFNVFVNEGELYILETTGNRAEIIKAEGSDYEIYFIITHSRTYRVKSGVSFGHLAGWD